MINTETGQSDGFWGPPDGPKAAAAWRQVEASSSLTSGPTQGEKPESRRGARSGLRSVPDKPRWRPWRYDFAAEAIKRAVALHVAALGEDFLPYSSGGKPGVVKVHRMVSAAISSRDRRNPKKAARAQRVYEGLMNLTLFASLFRLRMGKSEVQGHGLFAARAIAAQEVVTEFKGDLIGAAEAQQRVAHYNDTGLFGCIVQVGNGPLYLDALLQGYPTRFLNHSCDPNAYLYTVIAGKGAAQSKRVYVFTMKEIAAGEELCITYPRLFTISPEVADTKCTCGAPGCRQKIFRR
ncbi:conserved unknown protein [Ectocarpus siliculosus]|uniref:SET domain-containing protein n=1 Tax=Ectocarpus siliculosus TaxID=2880 RepID=D8LST4_ECTSI|nr:conserved unknown protein [Ectocarpus siliculosus]|eukprot:CBN75284.1 conserved unknown protein [Ectocarpus siliculosus]